MRGTAWRFGAIVGAVALLMTAPVGRLNAQAPQSGQAGLRVAHMAPGAPQQVDVWVDGQRVAGPVTYQQVSTLQNLPPGEHEVKVTAAGQAQADPAGVTERRNMEANKTYTIVVTGGPNDLRSVVLEDDLTPAPEGRGRLRFVNAVPNTRVNVTSQTGERLWENVDYRQTTDFKEVAAGNYTLQVTDVNTGTQLTTVQNVAVPSRGSAAAFATGSAQFGGAPVQQAPAEAMPRTGVGGPTAESAPSTVILAAGLALVLLAFAGSAVAIRGRTRGQRGA